MWVEFIDNIVDETITCENLFIFVDDDVKYVFVPSYENYIIRLSATDTGTMTYSVEDIALISMETTARKEFANVTLYAGREFVSEITNAPDVRLFVVKDGQAVIEIAEDGTETRITTANTLWQRIITFWRTAFGWLGVALFAVSYPVLWILRNAIFGWIWW